MLKVGWHNIENEAYHSDNGTFSKSSIASFDKLGPRKFHYNQTNGIKKHTKALDIGSAAHIMILEPGKYNGSVAIIPEDGGKTISKNSKKYRDWSASVKGKIELTRESEELVIGMSNSVACNDDANRLLSSGKAEITGVFDHHTGLRIRFRPDYYRKNDNIIVDLKTTALFNQSDFEKLSYEKKYHWSDYISSLGAFALTGKRHRYFFVVVDVEPPHEVAVYEMEDWIKDAGMIEAESAIGRLSECVKTGTWPGHGGGIMALGGPQWVRRKYYADI